MSELNFKEHVPMDLRILIRRCRRRMSTRSIRARIRDYATLYYYRIFRRGTFLLDGTKYPYFYHLYNRTWISERTVEIPIASRLMRQYDPSKILEVGNVLSHYMRISHDVLDKYESGRGVINQDVVEFSPEKVYDLILSISTIEHVGWDTYDEPKDPDKIIQAISRLHGLLGPEGKLFATLPLGYNPFLDALLKRGELPFTIRYCMKRISRDNRWVQVSWEDIRDSRFNEPFPWANGLVILILDKSQRDSRTIQCLDH